MNFSMVIIEGRYFGNTFAQLIIDLTQIKSLSLKDQQINATHKAARIKPKKSGRKTCGWQ